MNTETFVKCEVCGLDIEVDSFYIEDILCERSGKCSCGFFTFDYAYGCFIVFVDQEGFTWHKAQSSKEKERIQQEIESAAINARFKLSQ